MNERHFFADVDLPFHVWVRERGGARGFRWVLRHADELKGAQQGKAAGQGPGPGRRPNAPLQVG